MPPVDATTHVGIAHSGAYWARWATAMLYCVDNDVDPTPLLELLVPDNQVVPSPVIYRAQLTSPLHENFIWSRLPGIGVVAAFGGTLNQQDLVAQFTSPGIVDVPIGTSSYSTSPIWAQQSESLHVQLFNWLNQQPGFTFPGEPIFCVGYSLGGVVALGVATHLTVDSQPPPREVTYLTVASPPPWFELPASVPWGEAVWRSGDVVPSLYPHLRMAINPQLIALAPEWAALAASRFIPFRYPRGPQWLVAGGSLSPAAPPGLTTQQIMAMLRGEASLRDDHALEAYLRDCGVIDTEDAVIINDFAAEYSLSAAIRAVAPFYNDKLHLQPPPLVQAVAGVPKWEAEQPGLIMGDFLDFVRDP